MKTFKFGQLLEREDICDRDQEIKRLRKLSQGSGRVVVYGPRRFGKTSVVKNVTFKDFIAQKKSFALYADLFQLDSMEDFSLRLRVALEQALSRHAKIKTFIRTFQNYLKNFRIEIAIDPQSGAPSVTLSGKHVSEERSISDMFLVYSNLAQDYKTLLVFDEFQDITHVKGLEARLRSEFQNLTQTTIILMGSKSHILREIFHDESKPFYGFGTDVEFKEIPYQEWIPYIRERFEPLKLSIAEEAVHEICQLMRHVPNSIQEFCQWIALSGQTGELTSERIHANLTNLLENKASRYMERIASLSHKEKKVLLAVAEHEPVSSLTSIEFLQSSQVSATATRASVFRFTDQGLLDYSDQGYSVTDPLFRLFLLRQFKTD